MLAVVAALAIGYNVNLPADRSYRTAPVVAPTQVHFPCDGFGENITNQLPQALVDVTGYGDHMQLVRRKNCSPGARHNARGWNVESNDGRAAVSDRHDVPPRVRLLRWTTKIITPEQVSLIKSLALPAAASVWAWAISGGTVKLETPTYCAARTTSTTRARAKTSFGRFDVPGFTAASQLFIPSIRRDFDPTWSNIDGMGDVGTGEYDFLKFSSALDRNILCGISSGGVQQGSSGPSQSTPTLTPHVQPDVVAD